MIPSPLTIAPWLVRASFMAFDFLIRKLGADRIKPVDPLTEAQMRAQVLSALQGVDPSIESVRLELDGPMLRGLWIEARVYGPRRRVRLVDDCVIRKGESEK